MLRLITDPVLHSLQINGFPLVCFAYDTKSDCSVRFLLHTFYNVHFPLVTSKARTIHKIFVTLCAQVDLIRVAGLLVLGQFLSRGKLFLTLVTLNNFDLTVNSSIVLQGLGPTCESLATNTAAEGPLV